MRGGNKPHREIWEPGRRQFGPWKGSTGNHKWVACSRRWGWEGQRPAPGDLVGRRVESRPARVWGPLAEKRTLLTGDHHGLIWATSEKHGSGWSWGEKKGSLCGRGSTGVNILPFPSVSPNLQPPGPSPFRTFPLRHLPIQSHRSQRLPPLRRFTATPLPLPRPAYGEAVSGSGDKALSRFKAPKPCATLPAPPRSDSISPSHPPFRTLAVAGPGRAADSGTEQGRAADSGTEQRSRGTAFQPAAPALAPLTRPHPVAAADATPPRRGPPLSQHRALALDARLPPSFLGLELRPGKRDVTSVGLQPGLGRLPHL